MDHYFASSSENRRHVVLIQVYLPDNILHENATFLNWTK